MLSTSVYQGNVGNNQQPLKYLELKFNHRIVPKERPVAPYRLITHHQVPPSINRSTRRATPLLPRAVPFVRRHPRLLPSPPLHTPNIQKGPQSRNGISALIAGVHVSPVILDSGKFFTILFHIASGLLPLHET